jgi:hypothetical protein
MKTVFYLRLLRQFSIFRFVIDFRGSTTLALPLRLYHSSSTTPVRPLRPYAAWELLVDMWGTPEKGEEIGGETFCI